MWELQRIDVPVTIHDDYGCFRLLLESNLRVNMGAAVNSLYSPSDHGTLGFLNHPG